jgi:hypothetical protein
MAAKGSGEKIAELNVHPVNETAHADQADR